MKIHTGVVFSDPSIDVVVAAAPAWRERIGALTALAMAEWLAGRAVEHLDARYLGDETPESPLSRAWKAYREDSARETRGYRHPQTDFEFLLTLLPFEGRLYGIVRTEQFRWFEEYTSRPGISGFDYWDNTDRPKAVDTAEWNERRRIWLGALKECSVLTLDYSRDCGAPSDMELAAALPSFERRLDRTARDRTRNFFVREVARVSADAGINELVSAAAHWGDWLESDAGRAEFDREQARIAAILPRDVTVDMLRAPGSEYREAQRIPSP
jgi:hypothetical protein